MQLDDPNRSSPSLSPPPSPLSPPPPPCRGFSLSRTTIDCRSLGICTKTTLPTKNWVKKAMNSFADVADFLPLTLRSSADPRLRTNLLLPTGFMNESHEGVATLFVSVIDINSAARSLARDKRSLSSAFLRGERNYHVTVVSFECVKMIQTRNYQLQHMLCLLLL